MNHNNSDLARVEGKLDILIRLLALSVAPATDSLKDRAIRLSKAGMTPKEIALLFDTTPNTVSVILSAMKRGRKNRASKKDE